MFKPPLDGTDAITKWTSGTNNTKNGVFTSHGSFLTDGWSNNGLWQVDYDYRYTSTYYIGLLLLCDNVKITSDSLMSPSAWGGWEGQFPPQWGSFSILSAPSSFSKPSQTEWNHITIQKISENKVKLILNDTYEWIYQLNNLPNWSELHFGSKNNVSSPGTGGNIQFKNIRVISL